MTENLAGPGGGPDLTPINLELLYKDITAKGAGAFPTYTEKPPRSVKTATHGFEDNRFYKRRMKKK